VTAIGHDVPKCYVAPGPVQRALWTGRDDGADPAARRWHQCVQYLDLAKQLEHFFDPTICFIGYASDQGVRENQGRAGAADGPARLRARMASFPEVAGVALLDGGDIVPGASVLETQHSLAWAVERVVRAGAMPVILGGGHDMAFGHFLGVARARDRAPACINFDAHLDMRPIGEGGPNSGTPFTQALEWCAAHKMPFRYAALGTQRCGNTVSLFNRAHDAGALIVDADGFALDTIEEVMEALNDEVGDEELCLSIDLDVFAAAHAPGVSAPSAMGIAPDASFRRLYRGILESERVMGVEIAELCPALDLDDRTARLGAALAFEVAIALAAIAEEASESGDDAGTDGTDDADDTRS
jgi:formiminoglutamase